MSSHNDLPTSRSAALSCSAAVAACRPTPASMPTTGKEPPPRLR